MLCPGAICFASSTAPAIFIALEPPRRSPPSFNRLKIEGRALASEILKASLSLSPSRFLVVRPYPMPSVIELPQEPSSSCKINFRQMKQKRVSPILHHFGIKGDGIKIQMSLYVFEL